MGSLYYNMDQLSKSAKKLLGRLILSGTVQQWEKITEVQKIKIDLEEDLTDITHWIFQNIYSKNLSYLGRFNTDELTESNLSVLAVIIETQLIRNVRKEKRRNVKRVLKELTDWYIENIDYYKDNLLLKEAENFDKVIKDLDVYKGKLETLMDSDAYKKSKGDNVDIKKEIKDNLEKYTKSTSLLLNQISKQKKDIQSGNIEGLNINYELMMEFDEDPNKIEMNFKEIEDRRC